MVPFSYHCFAFRHVHGIPQPFDEDPSGAGRGSTTHRQTHVRVTHDMPRLLESSSEECEAKEVCDNGMETVARFAAQWLQAASELSRLYYTNQESDSSCIFRLI